MPRFSLPDLVLGILGETGEPWTLDELAETFHWYDPIAVTAAVEGLQSQRLALAMHCVEAGQQVTVYALTEAGARRYDTLFPADESAGAD